MDVENQKKPVTTVMHNLALKLSRTTLENECEKEDDLYGGLTDRSIEFAMLEEQVQDQNIPRFIKIEREIINYLKQIGLLMKTDPRAKQERYYQSLKRKGLKRAQTMIAEEKEIKLPSQTMTPPTQYRKEGVHLQMNTILLRRSEKKESIGSTPLINVNGESNANLKKSRFAQQQDDSNIYQF